jgi:hypothetical protein
MVTLSFNPDQGMRMALLDMLPESAEKLGCEDSFQPHLVRGFHVYVERVSLNVLPASGGDIPVHGSSHTKM